MAEPQAQLDTRAIELAVQANTLINQHLIECRDRYLALDAKITRATYGLVALLLTIIGYLVVNGGIPGVHH